jgi:hypothetical protein
MVEKQRSNGQYVAEQVIQILVANHTLSINNSALPLLNQVPSF